MSKFLPNDFDAGRPLALIAGRDAYPMLLARAGACGWRVRTTSRASRRDLALN